MDKILTVVIPTYNMEKLLDQCLTSLIIDDSDLLKQLEILVVIDGSKDRSSEIAHSYQTKYPYTFRVIDKENGNYGSCINRGLKEASGKYIKILDADDSFDNHNFSLFLHYLLKIDADCIMTDMKKVDEEGRDLEVCSYDLPSNEKFSLNCLGKAVDSMWMHCVCYRTENLRRINYRQTEGISYTDQEWICLPMSTAKSLMYFPYVIYKYLVGRDGQTISPDVWNKNFWMELRGVNVMIDQRSNLYDGCSEDGKLYIDMRIKHRILTCYHAYIIKFKSYDANDLMIDLDRRIAVYDSQFYKYLENKCRALRIFPYVTIWRISYNPNGIYLKSIRALSNIVNIVRQISSRK